MESDDDYESFSPEKTSPSPSPKHCRLKRLKKTSDIALDQSVSEAVDVPSVDIDKSETLETLKMSDVPAVEESGEAAKRDDLSSGDGDVAVRMERKETKRALDFDDEFNESDLVKSLRNQGLSENSIDVKSGEDDEKDGNFDVINGKITKKKRSKRSKEEIKVKPKKPKNKKTEEKERKAHLEQLHAESQRLLRETRGVSFKPVPLVQKPISSILDRIRQRKLEMSKKFSQSVSNDPVEEDDDCIKEDVMDRSKSVETENGDSSEMLEGEKKEKVSSDVNGEPESVDAGPDETDVSKEPKSRDKSCSPKAMNVESTPVLRAPVDDTQELFGDDQSTDSKESEDEESGEQTTSSQEEEMGPSLLTMQLKFDSVPDDISDEEENDKENANPHGKRQVKDSSSPRGDPVKAFVDEEAEEEDDSDNDRMLFGDEEENEDDDDLEELSKMIATGYKEKPIDKETRDELHQKWLQEKDAAGTDDLLRRLNVASKLREASLLDEEDGEEDVEMIDDDEEDEEREERPRAARLDSKKAKELIANMFTDKDEDFLSSDDEETEKILVKERVLNKAENKGKLVSPGDDEDSREVFGLIKKLNTVPEARKKAKTTSFFDTMLTGGNSNSSSKSSFLSRASSHSVPTSSKKKGSSGVRSFIFGRDDSNSRSSISISEDTSDTITSREVQTKKVATRYSSSQSQARSLTQTTKLVTESSSTTSLFEILKQSSMQSNVRKEDHKVELSQSVFAAFKIPKKPVKISGRV
ncbi:hypothetical protein CTI12_AA506400 [Artemisia annua]|uniref:Uncharacterized protein n=1 Tax=Artemisia annua TaxID=35608 RepID=A0A2U1LBI7_ARTAN|nr:hypothetical protein CTI12_AA506400 [Artemisia annua]